MGKKVVLVHQSSELYGSDRSFLTALDAMLEITHHDDIEVFLPGEGPLAELIKGRHVSVRFNESGVLRKRKLKAPISLSIDVWRSVCFYRKIFSAASLIYVNTVVCIAAILAIRASGAKGVVHVREIPGRLDGLVFRRILAFSRGGLIFNSVATKGAFRLRGDVVYNGVGQGGGERDVVNGLKNKLLLIGRISSLKGQELLLEALRSVTHSVELRIVGSVAPGCEGILTRLREAASGLDQTVSFFDFSPDPAEHFLWADFVVVPSIKPESFGRVAIEALEYGKPVIAAGHGGLIEIVEHKKSGFFFTPNSTEGLSDAINAALNLSSAEYASMSRMCTEVYESKFTEAAYKEAMRDYFERVLSQR